MEDDIRKGLPSASSMQRLSECPGSWKLSRHIPELPSDDANSGSRMHAALENPLADANLTQAEQDIVDACKELHCYWLSQLGLNCTPEELQDIGTREWRMWLRNENGEPILSGQADWILIGRKLGYICDYKTLFGDVPHAAENAQLHTLAALLRAAHPELECIYTAIISPNTSGITAARYDAKQLEDARIFVHQTLEATHTENPSYKAGRHCRYCRAKHVCPAIKEVIEDKQLWFGQVDTTKPDSEIWIRQRIQVMPNEQLSKLLDAGDLVSWAFDEAKKEAKIRLREHHEIPGWKIQPGNSRSHINDSVAFSERLKTAFGITPEEILAEASLTISSAARLVAKKLMISESKAKESVKALAFGMIDTTTDTDSIRKTS